MSGSSDSESDSDIEVRVEVERKSPIAPLVAVLCLLSYVYGMWLGMYLCPK